MSAELPSTEQIFTETSRLVPLIYTCDFHLHGRDKNCIEKRDKSRNKIRMCKKALKEKSPLGYLALCLLLGYLFSY